VGAVEFAVAFQVQVALHPRDREEVADLRVKNDRTGNPPPLAKPAAAMRNLIVAAIAGLSASACAGTQEYPLAPNMVRLDINPPVAPLAREATLRRAAELTLQNGYSAFRLEPIYVEAVDHFGVTVVMFHTGDPRAEDAFDAAEVLKKYSGRPC
jgi:hypothetical protein